MKKVFSLVTVALFVFCVLFTNMSVNADDSGYTISAPYEYPVKPNTAEWIGMHCTIERHEACEVPKDILARMTTDALVETVITYPFFVDTMAYNNFSIGLGAVSQYFSGIDELMSRDRQEVCESLRDYLQRKSVYGVNMRAVEGEACWPYVYYILAEQLLHYFEDSIAEKGSFAIAPYLETNVYTPKGSEVKVYAGYTWEDHGITYNFEKI